MNSELWNQLDPGFFAPVWLLVGLTAVITVLLLEIGAQRRRTQAVRLFAASHLVTALTNNISPLKRLLKRVLLISAVGLLFIAMARPHLFFGWRDENRSGLDILLAIDCSKSMLTEDVKPNRLERAKLAVSDFADHLPDHRLGLIDFAGDAFLQCPLTLDHDAFQTAVRELDTDTIPKQGTDLASAIDQAVIALNNQPNNLKFLILVTDGEDLEGRVLDAAKAAAQAGLKIYTVGVGTPNGDLIPERDDVGNILYHHDASGQIVQSKLDENTLRQIASVTGGAYVPLGQSGEGLEEIYDRYIAPLPKQHLEERREKVRFEQFEWPLAMAILFLMWEFLVNERIPSPTPEVPIAPVRRTARRRPAPNGLVATPSVALAGLLLSGFGPAHAGSTTTAERDYKAGKYEEALQNYRQAAESQPDRHDIAYDRGDAAYKAGDYTEAEEAFRKALQTPDLHLQEDTYYNLGNTQFKHGEALQSVDRKKAIGLWEKALQSYDSSLKLKPSVDARQNYEIVKKKLEQLKQQQQQQDQQDKQDKDNQSQDGKGQQSDQDGKQNKDKSQGDQQQKNQPGEGKPQDGKNGSQPQDQSQGNQPNQDKPSGSQGDDKNQASAPKDKGNAPVRAYSGTRSEDQKDPGIKSRQEAEDLLDSLKDDEKHVTARKLNELNGNNEPPPPASGKDW